LGDIGAQDDRTRHASQGRPEQPAWTRFTTLEKYMEIVPQKVEQYP
jgi:hypothetical protein